MTWEFGGRMSWIEVRLSEPATLPATPCSNSSHEAPWTRRPGASTAPARSASAGTAALTASAYYLATAASLDAAEWERWMTSPEGVALPASRRRLGRAAIADGDDPEAAKAAVDAVVAFYTVAPPEEHPEA